MCERKPMEEWIRSKLADGVKITWIECVECHCEFEVTEARAEILYPRKCFDCAVGVTDLEKQKKHRESVPDDFDVRDTLEYDKQGFSINDPTGYPDEE